MIATLTVLVGIYFVYMLSLIMHNLTGIFLIFLVASLYVCCLGFISKTPEHALYAFLLISLFFPKGGNNWYVFSIEEMSEISLCAVVQNIAAFAICVNILRVRRFKALRSRKLNGFCLLVFSLIIMSFFIGLARQIWGDVLVGAIVLPEQLVGNAQMLYGFIFLCGCVAFINRMEQVEKIFLIVITSTMAMVVESIMYFYLGLPLPLRDYVFNPSGRFNSMFFFNFITLPLVCFGGVGFVLYFASIKKRKVLLLVVPFIFLPILATFQRTPIVVAILIVWIFLMLRKNVRLRYALLSGGLLLAGATMLLGKVRGRFNEILASFFGQVRPDYLDSYVESWLSRVGAYYRGLEALVYSLPLGVGPTRMQEVMFSSRTPRYFGDFVQAGPALSLYGDIASGAWYTGPHNFYITFSGEYGLLGIVILVYFMYLVFSNLRLTGRTGKRMLETQPKTFVAQASVYSILVGLGFWSVFYDYNFYWFSFFLLFVLSFTADDRYSYKQVEAHGACTGRLGSAGDGVLHGAYAEASSGCLALKAAR